MTRTIRPMHLRDYLSPESGDKTSAASFARVVGVSHTTVLRWADGSIQPSGDALRRIHEASGGVVTPNDMLGIATQSPSHKVAL